MAISGYKADIFVSGEAIPFEAESMMTNTEEKEFVISDRSKRVWDRVAFITVERLLDAEDEENPDGLWIVVPENEYELNRLEGKITFAEEQEGQLFRVSGEYVPLTNVAGAYEYTFTLESDNQTIPAFHSAQMNRVQGKKDVTGSIAKWFTTSDLFVDNFHKGKPVVLEFYTDESDIPAVKLWALLSTVEVTASQEAVVEESIEFEAVADKEGRVISFG
ncbi:hypothetical protein [Bacillus horti]|uniref:Uncharacterized protein n=1 Tax=Caldalkalibacillus horti TaxID=77523 RepID=A0ABT9W5B6_9BACI|nr:hypothetical protein [Bacillus horti]MDQ0168448.1 hypothetical protein [Bacillus horti]